MRASCIILPFVNVSHFLLLLALSTYCYNVTCELTPNNKRSETLINSKTGRRKVRAIQPTRFLGGTNLSSSSSLQILGDVTQRKHMRAAVLEN